MIVAPTVAEKRKKRSAAIGFPYTNVVNAAQNIVKNVVEIVALNAVQGNALKSARYMRNDCFNGCGNSMSKGPAIIRMDEFTKENQIIPAAVDSIKSPIVFEENRGKKYSLKQWILFMIALYQKIAPQKIRQSCRFEPSCSNYMILAVNKYGILLGIIKGIRRLIRCRIPNNGIDYP